MKRLLLFVCLLGMVFTAAATSKFAIGDRAPELRIKEYLTGGPKADNLPKLIEFFHSASAPSLERLPALSDLAGQYKGKLNVIVISRESSDALRRAVGDNPSFFAAVDDGGKTFAAYDVQYVPFAVIVDSKGRIVWLGNPGTLSVEELQKYLK